MILDWKVFAVGSAIFAALTAIFGKMGVSEMNSNMATLVRTIVILAVTTLLLTGRSEWQRLDQLSSKGLLFLVLSGIATGLSWLCYYRALQLGPVAKVAAIDKMSVVIVVVFAALFLNESLTWKTGMGAALLGGGIILMTI